MVLYISLLVAAGPSLRVGWCIRRASPSRPCRRDIAAGAPAFVDDDRLADGLAQMIHVWWMI